MIRALGTYFKNTLILSFHSLQAIEHTNIKTSKTYYNVHLPSHHHLNHHVHPLMSTTPKITIIDITTANYFTDKYQY